MQVLELVRCVRTSLGSLRTIAGHSATLQELSLDRSCKGGGAYRPGDRDIRPLLVRSPDISDASNSMLRRQTCNAWSKLSFAVSYTASIS